MRLIVKREEPPAFISWKMLASHDWRPSYDNLQNPEKKLLHLALLEEQGFTCCYCGREVTLADSHIEHFRPQSKYSHLELTYENLFASCIRETHPNDPLHCGHSKGHWFDEGSNLSPLREDVESHFSYTLGGEIKPLTPVGEMMISVLDLGVTVQNSRRAITLQSVFNSDILATISVAELRRLAVAYRTEDQGKLGSFFQVLARFCEQLAESLSVG